MQLRDALDDYKRHRGHDTRFPGERRTVSGHFSGTDGRLVHVGTDGSLRDFGYPLTGLTGLERSRFGLGINGSAGEQGEEPEDAADIVWFDEGASSQRYVGDTALVETSHDLGFGSVIQYDITVGDVHLTRVEVTVEDGDLQPSDLELVVYGAFAPDGRNDRVGQLRYEEGVEVYHEAEHDFLASATGVTTLRGQLPATFPEVLDPTPVALPRDRDGDRYEEARLSGEVIVHVPFEEGATTVGTLLTDREETSRSAARERLADLLSTHDSVSSLEQTAGEGVQALPDTVPRRDALTADLRVLSLLSADSGLRIAGPDFDPYYRHSGGYGYTWFRDDAEISQFLLEGDAQFDIGLDDWHRRSAEMYVQTQREDGSWPHRVWPRNGALAPGWANARIEDGPDVDYQADQTGSVIAYLASLSSACMAVEGMEGTLMQALEGLDETLADDGRPVPCQNAWEDMSGRFTHTTATFLEAYSTLAGTDFEGADHAAERAREVSAALDDLWVPERGIYVLRETMDGEVDDRYDSATLALAAAHRAFDGVEPVDEERLDRLVSHVGTVVDELYHDPAESEVAGLVRYEGDTWRQRGQGHEKIWTVSTAWGANACAELSALLADHDDERADDFAERARELLALVSPEGPLCTEAGYLAEQFFDDGTPDSATPLGWPHAIRFATIALMDERGVLDATSAPADD